MNEGTAGSISLGEATWRTGALSALSDYAALTRPGIIALQLVSTCCAFVLASGGQADYRLCLWTLLGGALASASASAFNGVWDRDIDALMKRTRNRPVPAGRISPAAALFFSVLLLAVSLWVLVRQVNLPAAMLTLGGHLFYVLVYTIWLKRRTPLNIVIGGAAGAVPPVVGWAAATGQVESAAIWMFLIICLWTPPHFWALAININADYTRAKVPMLPVVRGVPAAAGQMLFYTLLLFPASAGLALSDSRLGWASLAALLCLDGIFLKRVFRLFRLRCVGGKEREQAAWKVFWFSLTYLAAFFAVLLIAGLM